MESYFNTKDSKFAQQALPAFRPMLTLARMMIVLGIFAIISFVLGPLLLVVNKKLPYYEKRYDDICELGGVCNVTFHIDSKIKGELRIKYKLTNFHQNHNQFVSSRGISQLKGEYVGFSDMLNCKPLRSINDSSSKENWILPCGLSAWSVFNDTFTILSSDPGFKETGITSSSDVDSFYKPLSSEYKTGYKWLENNTLFPGAQTNEHFIEWMRAGATSTVQKNYAICKDCELAKGDFTIQITNNYPQSFFDGKKYLVLEKNSFAGSKSLFLGVLFIVLAILCTIFIFILILMKVIRPRKLGDENMIETIIEQNKEAAISK
ncbi:hypothetical protein TVAG_288610 [Trichomonas vaginalis G3]|uniref:Uncharacterized protein n=1 Tax=Trichomonas vaginalis (strain ATCC PRA-98 / G3) TaxID=412133 RepID=A2FEC0_TRIV3|nr:aminophospholipid transmembrane transporter protein [Trichomonas vaginalis G3]EAX96760.1 hypothetical protein TVAG_288610 [Trichomonas vaginalis G3]KAI5520160.1 aminophospholipid transmembrane transporter protein [Trichomonas vaginalis G3]|eukprot:XP_001309690.1 hypothetical protein [Trichomonas vaginalis G3]